jgi:hypothetical protein
LLSELGDLIEAVKNHVASMTDLSLRDLASSLISKAPAGTAEMLMLVLVHREVDRRGQEEQYSNILPFQS